MKSLRVMGAADEGLGAPTIMNRAFAAKHGALYVHLVAFAVDVDRIFHELPEATDLPLGWEIALTERYLIQTFDPTQPQHRSLIEDVCLEIMEQTDEEVILGSQIPFAVYDAVLRNVWDETLLELFGRWRSPPRKLLQSLKSFWNDPAATHNTLRACLDCPLEPPASAPSRKTLQEWAALK